MEKLTKKLPYVLRAEIVFATGVHSKNPDDVIIEIIIFHVGL